jgi:hypothetical protein
MKATRRISILSLSLLVLFSSTSFMVGIHRCGGSVQNVALFHKAEGCAMERRPPCHRQQPRNCCEDQTINYQSQDFSANATSLAISSPAAVEFTASLIVLSEIIPSRNNTTPFYRDYDPPLPPVDRIVALQVFLI